MRKSITILVLLLTTLYMGYSQNSNLAKANAKSAILNGSKSTNESKMNPKRKCGTMEHLEMQKQLDPTLEQKMIVEEKKISEYIATHAQQLNENKTAYTLPVIVHIVQRTSDVQVTDQQVIDQIIQTNKDWAGTNGRSMESFPANLRGNAQITLCLATKDPNGNTLAQPGIHRVTTTTASFTYDDKVKYTAQGGTNAWDVTKYLNIWVCNLGTSLCGYAQFPTSGINATYGVVINTSCWGLNGTAQYPYNGGGTLSHEFGHCFNLRHIWGDAGGCSPDDGYADTPTQDVETYGNHSGTLLDACQTAAPGIMYMNIMDYSNDADLANVTPNQATVMQATIANYLSSIASNASNLCSVSSDPIALFTGTPTTLPVGNQVTYTSQSTGTITSYSWSFPGGTPSSSTSPGPVVVTYNTAGVYDATLTVGTPTSTLTKTGYITVLPAGALCGDWTTVQATGFAAQYRGLSNICIVDANTVWAPAYDGSGGGATIQEFTKTTNGGTTWTPGTISGNTAYSISNISAKSGTNAWAGLYDPNNGLGKVMVTTNGGTSWTQQTTAAFSTANQSWLNFVHFFDANNGVCMGDPAGGYWEIYTTTNGGTTWTRVPTGSIPAPGGTEYGWTGNYCAVGNTVWFGSNTGKVYKSTDKGLTWTATATGMADVNEVKFIDANNGIAIQKVYNQSSGALTTFNLKRTTNGGSTWTTLTPTGAINTGELAPVPGTTSTWFSVGGVWPYVASTYGSSYSIDNGSTWTAVDATQYNSVTFLNSSVGWAGGWNTSATVEGISKWTPCTTNILENVSTDNILLYPNPAFNEINVQVPYSESVKMNITIMDIYGKLCKKVEVSSNVNEPIKVELSGLSNGIYLIKGESSHGEFVKKISIIK